MTNKCKDVECLSVDAAPLNLVFVIDSLVGGGAEVVVLRLVSALVSLGHNVRLVCINQTLTYDVDENIKIFFVNKFETKKRKKFLYYRRTADALQKLLDELDSLQSIHALVSNLPETDRIVQYLYNYPVLHCIHNNLYYGYIKTRKNPLKRFLKLCQLRRLYNKKHLIFVSYGVERDMLQRVGVKPCSSRVIYNPFPISEIQDLAKKYPVELEDYFIHVGRFNKQKRHDKLLKIYAESGLNNQLLLLGEGSDEQIDVVHDLIKQNGLEGRVIIRGFSQNPFPYIRHAIALLLTSDYEGLSNVIIEALACGTPVISYDCPSGPGEILVGELQEYLVSVDDTNGFVDKLKEISQNKLRISSENVGLDRFEALEVAKEYVKAINKVILARHEDGFF